MVARLCVNFGSRLLSTEIDLCPSLHDLRLASELRWTTVNTSCL